MPGIDLQENMCLHNSMTFENKLFYVLFHVTDFTHSSGRDCLVFITNAMK